MSAKTTTTTSFLRPIQFFPETNEGSFQDAAGNTYEAAGVVSKFSVKIDNSYRDISQIGPEDLIAILRGRKITESNLTIKLVDGAGGGKNLLRYCMNKQNRGTPAFTPNAPLSMATSFYLNGTEYWLKMLGSRARTISFSCGVEKDWEFSIDFFHTDILEPTTSAPAQATMTTTFPSGDPYDWLSGGANPVTFAGTALPVQEIAGTMNRNTNGDWVMGNRKAHSGQPHGRRMGGTAKLLYMPYTGSTLLSGTMEADTAGTLAMVMKSAGLTLSFLEAKFTNLGRDNDSEDSQATAEDFGWKCEGFTDLS